MAKRKISDSEIEKYWQQWHRPCQKLPKNNEWVIIITAEFGVYLPIVTKYKNKIFFKNFPVTVICWKYPPL